MPLTFVFAPKAAIEVSRNAARLATIVFLLIVALSLSFLKLQTEISARPFSHHTECSFYLFSTGTKVAGLSTDSLELLSAGPDE
jgi:hypothetical protein